MADESFLWAFFDDGIYRQYIGNRSEDNLFKVFNTISALRRSKLVGETDKHCTLVEPA